MDLYQFLINDVRVINEDLEFDDFLKCTEPRVFGSVRELRIFASRPDRNVCLHWLGTTDHFRELPAKVKTDVGGKPHSTYVVGFDDPEEVIDEDYNTYIFVQGDRAANKTLSGIMVGPGSTLHYSPEDTFLQSDGAGAPAGGGELAPAKEEVIMQGGDQDVALWLQASEPSPESKTATVLYHFYPHIRPYAHRHYLVLRPEVAWAHIGEALPEDPDWGNTEGGNNFVVGSFIWTIGANYTFAEQVQGQCLRRYRAGAASINEPEATASEFATVFQAVHFAPYNRSGRLDSLIGNTVAINKEHEWDSDVKEADLLPLEALDERHNLMMWGRALYTQLRLVYTNTHEKTLSMAMALQPLVATLCESLGEPWATEAATVKDLKATLTNCPYAGLVQTLPESRQTKSWARIAYMGLKYQEKNLTDADKASNFSKYAIENVGSHISTDADKELCVSLVSAIAPQTIIGKALLCSRLPLDSARAMMAKHDDDFKDQVLRHLIDEGTECNWRTFRMRQLQVTERKRVSEQLTSMARNTINDKMNRLYIAARDDRDQVEAATKRIIINQLNDELNSLLGREEDLFSVATAPDSDHLQATFEEEVQRFQDILARARALEYDQIGQAEEDD